MSEKYIEIAANVGVVMSQYKLGELAEQIEILNVFV